MPKRHNNINDGEHAGELYLPPELRAESACVLPAALRYHVLKHRQWLEEARAREYMEKRHRQRRVWQQWGLWGGVSCRKPLSPQ